MQLNTVSPILVFMKIHELTEQKCDACSKLVPLVPLAEEQSHRGEQTSFKEAQQDSRNDE